MKNNLENRLILFIIYFLKISCLFSPFSNCQKCKVTNVYLLKV